MNDDDVVANFFLGQQKKGTKSSNILCLFKNRERSGKFTREKVHFLELLKFKERGKIRQNNSLLKSKKEPDKLHWVFIIFFKSKSYDKNRG